MVAGPAALPSPEQDSSNRREARIQRRAQRLHAANGATATSTLTEIGNASEPAAGEPQAENSTSKETRRQHRPRAPRAERHAAQSSEPSGSAGDGAPAASTESAADALEIAASLPIDTRGRSGARVAARARKRQQAAASAVDSTSDNPAVGALNRHLNMLMQQVMTAHRVIGRTAAERDALRQQLADLQGIPVEEIIVSTIGASTEVSTRSTSSSASAPQSPSRFAKLNYFGGDDFQLVRKRRLTLAGILIVAGVIFTVLGQQLGVGMPTDISRESLTVLPFLGPLMTLFLAGWVLFRIVRVFGRVARWVYPSENSRRRRR